MKRAVELRGLSEQHRNGLMAARNLRLASEGNGSLPGAVAAFLAAWRDEIRAHFRAEEELLLPEFSRAVPPDHPLIVRTLTEHVAFRRAVADLEKAGSGAPPALAAEIAAALERHIRFEERVLFPALEEALAGASLESLGQVLPKQPGACRAGARQAGRE